MMSSLQRRVVETSSSSAPTQPTNNNTSHKNATNIEACFSTGLDLSDFGSNINSATANTAISASAALAKIKSDAAARIRREEQEEAALERRVAAVDDVILPANNNDGNTDSKDILPRALHPNSQPSSMAGEDRNNNFIQFQTAGGNDNFLSSLVTTHKTEGREISNKSRKMLKGKVVKPGQRIGSAGWSRQSSNHMKQKASGKSVVKKSFKSKAKF
ncbi:hypothetical protein ACHAWT_000201 [Skeletonema menzelii]